MTELKKATNKLKRKALICMALFLLFNVAVLTLVSCDIAPEWDFEWSDNGDMETLRDRMVADLYDPTIDPSEYMCAYQDDGSFATIDYGTALKDEWHPAKHLEYIVAMQKAVYSEGNTYYRDNNLMNMISGAIHYWAEKNYYCDWNDWWNGLGTGPNIANILLYPNESVLKADIENLTQKLKNITCFSEKKKYNVKEREINSTGGNLTDAVNHSLKFAVITRDGSGIKWLTRLMENELRPFPSRKIFNHRWDVEGIKADMSFQQHFETLYLGGYGETFMYGMNTYIRYTSGTQFAMVDDAVNFYQDFLLDGIQYATRGDYRDINASGRGIVREGSLLGIAGLLREGCQVLLNSDCSLKRADELQSLLINRTGASDIGAGGHKYFWNSDYSSYNDTNYMATIRAASKRTKYNEALNGENIWGHYLGAGTTFYYNKGDEYYDIMPLMDWNKVPGTTAVQGYLPYTNQDRAYTRMGKTSFVGGVSTGKVGMQTMDYRDNYVKAKKSWFMFEEGVVCLGTDITSSKKGDLFTTINQSLLRGNAVISIDGNITSSEFINHSGKVDWAYNNGIGYISSAPLSITALQRSGDWKDISERVASKMHRDNVFEIGISHGNKPRKASYDYTVVMNTTAEKLNQYMVAPTLITLRNDSKCQAVYSNKTDVVMATFWGKDELSLPSGNKLKVNTACTIIVEKAGDRYIVYVSDPNQDGGKLKVQIGSKEHNVKFEKGMWSGKTMVFSL